MEVIPFFLVIAFLPLKLIRKQSWGRTAIIVTGVALFGYFAILIVISYSSSHKWWEYGFFAIMSLVWLRKVFSERNSNPPQV